jgi:hypothetical protein
MLAKSGFQLTEFAITWRDLRGPRARFSTTLPPNCAEQSFCFGSHGLPFGQNWCSI